MSADGQQFDLSEIIETTLAGMFQMIQGLFTTSWAFVIQPRVLLGENFPRIDRKHLKPITYAVLSYAGMVATFAQVTRRSSIPPFVERFPGIATFRAALPQADYRQLFIALLPYLLEMGMFAWCISVATKLVGSAVTFQKSLELFAYPVGAANLMYAAVTPAYVAVRLPQMPIARSISLIVLETLVVVFLVRCAWCYFRLLRLNAGMTVFRTFATVSIAIVLFIALLLVAIVWLTLLVR
jgi:hypothetical protein